MVSCQNERSQLQNREQAMRMLRARLIAPAEEQAADAASAARRSQVRTVDRSERIRTYNFPENRISDHRIGFKAYNLDQVLNGDLRAVIAALQQADTAERLARVGRRRLLDRAPRRPVRPLAGRGDRPAGARPGWSRPRRTPGSCCPSSPASSWSGCRCSTELDDDHVRRFEQLVARRAERVPLQHLTGRAHFRYIELEVGPGVFVPRPETEVMTGWAIERAARR